MKAKVVALFCAVVFLFGILAGCSASGEGADAPSTGETHSSENTPSDDENVDGDGDSVLSALSQDIQGHIDEVQATPDPNELLDLEGIAADEIAFDHIKVLNGLELRVSRLWDEEDLSTGTLKGAKFGPINNKETYFTFVSAPLAGEVSESDMKAAAEVISKSLGDGIVIGELKFDKEASQPTWYAYEGTEEGPQTKVVTILSDGTYLYALLEEAEELRGDLLASLYPGILGMMYLNEQFVELPAAHGQAFDIYRGEFGVPNPLQPDEIPGSPTKDEENPELKVNPDPADASAAQVDPNTQAVRDVAPDSNEEVPQDNE